MSPRAPGAPGILWPTETGETCGRLLVDEEMTVGELTISYTLPAEGEPLVGVTDDQGLDLVTKLGMLRLAENSLLQRDEWPDGGES